MKALVYSGKEDLRVDEAEKPRCQDGCAIIEVRNAGICGSDLTIYAGKHPRAKPPVILGHEFSGVIVQQRGKDRPDLREGDRVTVEPTFSCGLCDLCRSGSYHICRKKGLYGIDADGAFAAFVQVPLKRIFRLPGETTFEEGAMVEPLAVAVRAVTKSRLTVGESVVVLGAGPIGVLTAQVGRAAGAARVFIMEPIEFRRQMAKKMGFPVFDPDVATPENVLQAAGGSDFDVVFDCAGVPPAASLATQLVKRTGRIVIVSIYKKPVPLDLAAVTYGEIQMIGTCIYTFDDFSRAISLLEEKKVEVLPLVTHRFPLDKGIEAFEILIKGENAQKVLFTIS
ncbi:MAG: alcohol dehydrogenase catalytic domain-containing protein [Proteobacteria bacterium]|nr:alcohol dehydrogenase catalytic domain-containing protein [Pseudomonadota bacterium]